MDPRFCTNHRSSELKWISYQRSKNICNYNSKHVSSNSPLQYLHLIFIVSIVQQNWHEKGYSWEFAYNIYVTIIVSIVHQIDFLFIEKFVLFQFPRYKVLLSSVQIPPPLSEFFGLAPVLPIMNVAIKLIKVFIHVMNFPLSLPLSFTRCFKCKNARAAQNFF